MNREKREWGEDGEEKSGDDKGERKVRERSGVCLPRKEITNKLTTP